MRPPLEMRRGALHCSRPTYAALSRKPRLQSRFPPHAAFRVYYPHTKIGPLKLSGAPCNFPVTSCRVTGSGPMNGVPVLSASRQRGSSSGLSAVVTPCNTLLSRGSLLVRAWQWRAREEYPHRAALEVEERHLTELRLGVCECPLAAPQHLRQDGPALDCKEVHSDAAVRAEPEDCRRRQLPARQPALRFERTRPLAVVNVGRHVARHVLAVPRLDHRGQRHGHNRERALLERVASDDRVLEHPAEYDLRRHWHAHRRSGLEHLAWRAQHPSEHDPTALTQHTSNQRRQHTQAIDKQSGREHLA
eukprot:366566-Chlamydomonas_euryale.AAC.18